MTEPVQSLGDEKAQPIRMPATALAAGDRIPNFMAADQHGAMRPFYERTLGRPLALLLAPLPGTLSDYAAAHDDYVAGGVDIMGLVPGDSAQIPGAQALPFLVLGDAQGRILAGLYRAAGLQPGPAFLLLDPNQRLIVGGNGAMASGPALQRLAASGPVTSSEVTSSVAPVLIVPDVLDRATTLALIRRWHEQGNDEGRVATVIKGEKTNQLYEHLKKRRDHIIRDDAVTQVLATTIGRRVAPEMAKAFQFTAGFRYENFKIACY
ncbi:MAG: hypothetical protein ACREFM_12390, partial [Hypericibacter sp.]